MPRNADHMRLQFLLLKRMEERGVSFPALSKLAGIKGDRLRAIAHNKVKRVTTEEIPRILGALGISANDFFDCYEADVFTGARIEKEITLHLVIKSDAGNGAEGPLDRVYISAWDWYALMVLYAHATELGIRVKFEPHSVNYPRETSVRSVREMFPEGTHIVIGSQLSFRLTERVVCLMHEVAPFDETKIPRFPVHFVWDPARNVASSFGRAARRDEEPGIYATRDDRPVGRRVDTKSGEGHDAGLIVAYRITDPARVRKNGLRSERCICVLAGHGGAGTLACAQALADPGLASEIYPPQDYKPRLRVVQATYDRPFGAGRGDDREIRKVELAPGI